MAQSPSAVELRKNLLRRGNLMVTSSATSGNVMGEIVETTSKKTRKFILVESWTIRDMNQLVILYMLCSWV